jgi:UDP-glucose 4-epimerase
MVSLVTGGAGFIGSHLVESLVEAGRDVRVLDDFSTGTRGNLAAVEGDIDLVVGSVTDDETVDLAMRDVSEVFHLAAVVGVELVARDPAASLWSNVAGAHKMIHAALRSGSRLVFTSSSEAYGKSQHFPQSESDDRLLGPTSELRWGYAESKAVGELLALGHAAGDGLHATVVRLFNVVGPRQTGAHGMVLPRFVQWALNGSPIEVYGDGSQTRTFCAVADVAPALVRVAECEATNARVLNLGSNLEISMLELARTVCRVLGTENPIRFVSYGQLEGRSVDFVRRVPDTALARELIGFFATTELADIIRSIAADLDR